MRRGRMVFTAAAAISVMAVFPAFAGEWRQEADGRYWYDIGAGDYAKDGWYWLDGNRDGVAESYYFDVDGYLVTGPGQADGYDVDDNGAWMVDGVVQTQDSKTTARGEEPDPEAVYGRAVMLNNSLNDVNVQTNINMEMNIYGMTMQVPVTSKFMAHGLLTEQPRIYSEMGGTMLGARLDIKEFYMDGQYYFDSGSTKIRMEASAAEAIGEIGGQYHILDEDGLSLLTGITIRQEGENRVIGGAFDQSLLKEAYDSEESYNIKDAYMELTINPEGYCIRQKLFFNLDSTIYPYEGVSVYEAMKMEAEVILENPGRNVEVPIPSAAEFEEIYTLK